MGLVTKAFCRNFPSLASTTKLPDALLDILITTCSRSIERFCQRTFLSTTYTNQLMDGTGARAIILPNFPLVSISAIGIRNNDNVWSAIDPTNVEFETDVTRSDGEVWFAPGITDLYTWFPQGERNIRMTYVAGFATIPEDVQMGAALWIAHAFQSSRRDQTKQSEQIGKYGYTNVSPSTSAFHPEFSAYPPDEARRFLSSYRKFSI